MDITEALGEIEKEAGITPPLGAFDLSLKSRYRQVLLLLRSHVCPQQEVVKARLDSDGGNLAVVIADTLLSVFSGIPAPIATISSRIAKIGLERFCLEPDAVLSAE